MFTCTDPEFFYQMGCNFDNVFFFVDEGRKNPDTTISGPSPARWRADNGPISNAGFVVF